MMISEDAPSPTLPRKRGREQQSRRGRGDRGPRAMMARPTTLATLGMLRPAPSPACGGGVGRGRVPLALSYGKGRLRPDAQRGRSDG
jgi:hypothetical protein